MKEKIEKLIEISEYLNDCESVIQLKRLEESLEEKSYILSVMGQFSAGKSRLINNILERKVLPVHTTETTALITFIKYGETDIVELVYPGGNSKFISIEESLDMWQNGAGADKLSDVECIYISLRSDLLKNGLILVDTPGINTVIDKHIQLTESIIVNSDRVLYVLGKPITESDADFVRAIHKFGTDIVFVRTHMDELKCNEEDANATIKAERENLSKFSQEEIFFVSNEGDNEYYNGLLNLSAYLSCGIAENINKAIQDNVLNKLKFIAAKQEGRILDRRMELSLILNNRAEEYRQNKEEIRSSLERLEKNLEQKRALLKEKYDKEKEDSKEELENDRKAELKKLTIGINNTPNSGFTGEYHERIGQDIREACVRMRSNYIECFNRLIRDNKASFIEEMKDNANLSIWIPDMPDNIEEFGNQMNDLRDRLSALDELKKNFKEELERIEHENQKLEEKNASIEEEKAALQESLSVVQEQLNAFPDYVARYITVKGDHTGERTFKVIGNLIDWATIFIPGPTWAKAGSKILNLGSKGAKAVKAIKAADAFTDGARILAKVAKGAQSGKKIAKNAKAFEKGARAAINAIDIANKGKKVVLVNKLGEELGISGDEIVADMDGSSGSDTSPFLPEEPKPSLLDYIGLDYWFAKIGKKFDMPDRKVIDVEYENKYNSAKREIENNIRMQTRKEFEKRKEQEDLKNKEEENNLLKEITSRKERAAQEQIEELRKEIEQEKQAAHLKSIRNHYISAADDNLTHAREQIISDVLPDINDKMDNYINTYDFRMKEDISFRKRELDELEEKYNSAERAELEKECSLCEGYSAFLESEVR